MSILTVSKQAKNPSVYKTESSHRNIKPIRLSLSCDQICFSSSVSSPEKENTLHTTFKSELRKQKLSIHSLFKKSLLTSNYIASGRGVNAFKTNLPGFENICIKIYTTPMTNKTAEEKETLIQDYIHKLPKNLNESMTNSPLFNLNKVGQEICQYRDKNGKLYCTIERYISGNSPSRLINNPLNNFEENSLVAFVRGGIDSCLADIDLYQKKMKETHTNFIKKRKSDLQKHIQHYKEVLNILKKPTTEEQLKEYIPKLSKQEQRIIKKRGTKRAEDQLTQFKKFNLFEKNYLNYLQQIARAPQTSYDELIKTLEAMKQEGYGVDFSNDNNIHFDPETQQFGIVDVGPISFEHNEWTLKSLIPILFGISSGTGRSYFNFILKSDLREQADQCAKFVLDKLYTATKNNTVNLEHQSKQVTHFPLEHYIPTI